MKPLPPRPPSGVEGVAPGWQRPLARQLGVLGRWTEGAIADGPVPDMVLDRPQRFLETEYLWNAILRSASLAPDEADDAQVDVRDLPETGRHVAASRFVRRYVAPVTVVALVGLAHGVGIDLSPERSRLLTPRGKGRMRVVVDLPDDEVVRCRERPTLWSTGGPVVDTLDELRRYVWERLYARHLAPVWSRVQELTTVSPRLVWTNTAEWAGLVSDAAEAHLPAGQRECYAADREALLGAPALPGIPGENPMRGRIDWAPTGDPQCPTLQTRHVCCLTYLLDDRLGLLCENCPFLDAEHRVALVNSRNGHLVGGATAAEIQQQVVERGLARPSIQRALRNARRQRATDATTSP